MLNRPFLDLVIDEVQNSQTSLKNFSTSDIESLKNSQTIHILCKFLNCSTSIFQELENRLISGLFIPQAYGCVNPNKILLQRIQEGISSLHSQSFSIFDALKLNELATFPVEEQKNIHEFSNELVIAYQRLNSIFDCINILWLDANKLFEELLVPYWNPDLVENLLKKNLDEITSLARKIRRVNSSQLLQDNEKAIARSFFNEKIFKHEAFVEYCIRKEKLTYIVEFDSQVFDNRLQGLVKIIEEIPEALCDEVYLIDSIAKLRQFFLFASSNQQQKIRYIVQKVLLHATLSANLFDNLIPIINLVDKEIVMENRLKIWNENIADSLRKGNVGVFQDALDYYTSALWIRKNFSFSQVLSFQTSSYAKQACELLSKMPYNQWLSNGLQLIFVENLNSRLLQVHEKFRLIYKESKEITILDNFFKIIDLNDEIGIKVKLIHLAETLLDEQTTHLSELQIIIAILEQDFDSLLLLLNNSKKELWDPLSSGLIPFELITENVASTQLRSQKKITEKNDILNIDLKQHNDEFYLKSHHYLSQRLLDFYPKSYYQKVIQIFEKMGSISNQTFLNVKGLYIGAWDDLPKTMLNIMKIYLPQEEHSQWMKHCSEVNDESPEKIEREAAYAGSQDSYGLWFHLCANATKELIESKTSWRDILTNVGYWRKIIALIFWKVQVPLNGYISFAAYKRINSLNRRWPGPQQNFGIFRPDSSYQTNFSLKKRYYYLKKVQDFIELFEVNYSEELDEIYNSIESNGKGQKYTFGGCEFVIYPSWIPSQKKLLTVAIARSINIGYKKVYVTELLWNWKPLLPHFSIGNHPFITKTYSTGFWIHTSGENKKLLDQEIEKIFYAIIVPGLSKENFEKLCAKFLYYFYQSIPFIRGSGAIGLILLDAFLSSRGISMPNAPSESRSLDCEAMCMSEDEFTKKFIGWINNQNLFEFQKFIT